MAGTGSLCEVGQTSNSSSDECLDCPVGRTDVSESRRMCLECLPTFYSLRARGPEESCHSCATNLEPELPIPMLRLLDVPLPNFRSNLICPRGVQGSTTGFCPMQGLGAHAT
jgi:hypothetical protein